MIFITGAAGFIGCNLARYFLERGQRVTGLDNLSRPGAARNLEWLRESAGGGLVFHEGDVRDANAVEKALPRDARAVVHLAGQVAVTTSVRDPRADFEHNALGTLNVLEAVRKHAPGAAVLYASTNKVYGGMQDLELVDTGRRYAFADRPLGIGEDQPLDFHSPYGCSKGCGDQYTRDYARIYGLRTVVLRQSCIYGTRQFGVEDQGWVAHFFLAAARGEALTIYGDGKQVRDLLWIDDLLAVYEAAIERIDRAAGQVFNIGGGPANSLAVWTELGARLEALCGRSVKTARRPWRPGDQKVYVSDVRKACRLLDWKPRTSLDEGLPRLWDWVRQREGEGGGGRGRERSDQ